MKRLYFTLPRKPLSSNRRADNAPRQACTFDALANLIDPEPETSTVWKKAVDRENKALLFYQLDLGDELPKFAKCLYIKAEEFRLNNHSEYRLVPSAFLDENLAPADDDAVPMMLPVAPNVSSIMDVVKLLQYVELFPEAPDDEEAERTAETADVEDDNVEGSSLQKTAMTSYAGEAEHVSQHCGARDVVEGDTDDNTDCGSEYAPSAASENKEIIPSKKSGQHKPTKTAEAPVLNDSQVAYAKVVKQSLEKPGPGKEEIYPGASIYASSRLLQQIKRKYLQGVPRKGKVSVTSKLPGAHLAIALMDSLGKFTDKLPLGRTALKEIFDNDFLTKLAKFVNLHHADVVNGIRLPLSPDQMIGVIQNRLRYHRRRDQMIGKETEYMMKKRLNLLPLGKQKRLVSAKNSMHTDHDNTPDHMVSLIPSATDIQWDPCLPYNHPDFRPSYLFHRPNYVPFWPPGDNPPVYIKKQDLEYFCSEQSHTEYPETSRWIRAVMYKIFDEQAMLHMCYVHWKKQKEQQGLRFIISTHSLLSPGFVKMFDEFMRFTGRLTEDVEFLMRTLQYWFKDYKRTIMKRKVLTNDPTSVKVNHEKTMGEKLRGKKKR